MNFGTNIRNLYKYIESLLTALGKYLKIPVYHRRHQVLPVSIGRLTAGAKKWDAASSPQEEVTPVPSERDLLTCVETESPDWAPTCTSPTTAALPAKSVHMDQSVTLLCVCPFQGLLRSVRRRRRHPRLLLQRLRESPFFRWLDRGFNK